MPKTQEFVHRVEGVAGTRRSPRVYTHAIVGVRRIEEAVAAARHYYGKTARGNHAYYVREANPATRQFDHRPEELARIERDAAMPVEEYVKLEQDRAEARERQHTNEPVVLQWSMSERAASAKLGYWYKLHFDVRVEPVVRSER